MFGAIDHSDGHYWKSSFYSDPRCKGYLMTFTNRDFLRTG